MNIERKIDETPGVIEVRATWQQHESAPTIQAITGAARRTAFQFGDPTKKVIVSKLHESGGCVKGEHYWLVTYTYSEVPA